MDPNTLGTQDYLDMELLTQPKTEYLLDASLESLHVESLEWLKEIDFWSDEIAFFYKLLKRTNAAKDYPGTELAIMEKKLISVNSDKVSKVRSDIYQHERALAGVLKSAYLLEEDRYREKHRQLLMDIYSIHTVIRSLKKEVFSFIQKHE